MWVQWQTTYLGPMSGSAPMGDLGEIQLLVFQCERGDSKVDRGYLVEYQGRVGEPSQGLLSVAMKLLITWLSLFHCKANLPSAPLFAYFASNSSVSNRRMNQGP